MNKPTLPLALMACIAVTAAAQAQETKKITVTIRGVVNDRCAEVLRTELGKVQGIKFDANRLSRGEGRQFFCEPFVIEIADLQKTEIGALAQVVGQAQTPARGEMEPRLNLVMYTDERINEDLVVGLRNELANVNGALANDPGGLGGVPNQGWLWLRLDDSGGASLEFVLSAAEKANVKISLTK
jgi:hypothetical protein